LDISEDFRRGRVEIFYVTGSPIGTSYGVGEDCAGDFQSGREIYLERVSLDCVGHGDHHSQARFLVVSAGRENERGTPSGLLVAGLSGGEINSDEIAGVGNVLGYHTSLPTGAPQSCSR